MNCRTPGLPVHHQLPESTHPFHRVGDAIQPSHPLSSPSPPALNLSQHQGLFTWVSSLHQVAKVLGISASTSVLPMNTQDQSPLEWVVGSPNSPRDSQESSLTPQFKSINPSVLSFLYSPTLTSIHDYWNNHNFDWWTFVSKVMSLLFNMLSRLVITFLPRNKHLLIHGYSHHLQWFSVQSVNQFSRSVVSSSLKPHKLQHARLPCPSPNSGAYSNSGPLSQWCHPTISSSAIPFSSHLQSFLASGSFLMSQFFASGGQSIGVSASTSVLPRNIQDWFPLGWTGWISLQTKGLSRVFSTPQFKRINSSALSLLHSPTLTSIHDHWENHSLD